MSTHDAHNAGNDLVHGILGYVKLQDRPSALELQVQRRDYIDGQDHYCLTIAAPIVRGELLWNVTRGALATVATATAITYSADSMETVVTLIDGVKYPSDTEGISLQVRPLGEEQGDAMAGWFVRKDMTTEARRELIRNALSVLLTK